MARDKELKKVYNRAYYRANRAKILSRSKGRYDSMKKELEELRKKVQELEARNQNAETSGLPPELQAILNSDANI